MLSGWHHCEQWSDLPGQFSKAVRYPTGGQSNTPLLSTNTTGFMVGVVGERNGIVKHGAKFIQAVANATVPN